MNWWNDNEGGLLEGAGDAALGGCAAGAVGAVTGNAAMARAAALGARSGYAGVAGAMVGGAAEDVASRVVTGQEVTLESTAQGALFGLAGFGLAKGVGAAWGRLRGGPAKAPGKAAGLPDDVEAAQAAAARKAGPTCCFVAGTLVALAGAAAPAPAAAAIEDVALGQRVATVEGGASADVDASWRRVELGFERGDGRLFDIALLRPEAWVERHGLEQSGDRVRVDFEELGLHGWARVRRVTSGPVIEDAPGRVVLGTFTHVDRDVYEVGFAEGGAVLRGTGGHPLWSLDRDEWVHVRNLQVGERLQTAEGAVTIEALEKVRGEHRVYNLEVEGDHEYLIGEAGVRAHNPCPDPEVADLTRRFEETLSWPGVSDGSYSYHLDEWTAPGRRATRIWLGSTSLGYRLLRTNMGVSPAYGSPWQLVAFGLWSKATSATSTGLTPSGSRRYGTDARLVRRTRSPADAEPYRTDVQIDAEHKPASHPRHEKLHEKRHPRTQVVLRSVRLGVGRRSLVLERTEEWS
jgi:hypothetical protein